MPHRFNSFRRVSFFFILEPMIANICIVYDRKRALNISYSKLRDLDHYIVILLNHEFFFLMFNFDFFFFYKSVILN